MGIAGALVEGWFGKDIPFRSGRVIGISSVEVNGEEASEPKTVASLFAENGMRSVGAGRWWWVVALSIELGGFLWR